MKRISVRIISLLLVLAMVLSFAPALSIDAHALTTNQQNIVDRANYMYDSTWVCQKTVPAWRDETTFYEGETYRIPYGQPINSGYYIGYGVSVDDYLAAAADASSIFYSGQSEYNGWTSTYYANDCSAFVSWCWGITRCTTYSIPFYSTYISMADSTGVYNLQVGDALNSNDVGHVVLVTGLTYDDSGSLIQIEITEQTPPQLKRSYYTPAELAAKYGDYYTIQRYEGTVPAAPVTGYITKCTGYAAHCEIEITADTAIMSLPCAAGVDSKTAQLGTAADGDVYTATRLYKNTQGELWYRVTTAEGETGYINAGSTAYLEQILTDITLTGASSPSGHVKGNIFYVQGTIASQYNDLTSVAVYIHSGFGVDGAVVTGASATVSGNSYTLLNSTIDNSTAFNSVPLGNHTYAVSAVYKNYYVSDSGSLVTNSDTLYLMEDYFVVISSSVDQDSCDHTYSDTTTVEATCVSSGAVVHACSVCGYLYQETTGVLGHSYGEWVTVDPATCTEDGSAQQVCSACGDIQTQVIPATGHAYDAVTIPGTCQEGNKVCYTCSNCGDSYTVYAGEWSEWSTVMPEGVDEKYIETRQEYRYSDYETVTSTSETLEGYTQIGSDWAESGTETICYVPSWPSGFDTGNSLYTQYNNTKMTASETATAKTVINSDEVVGYLYYHWCAGTYTEGPINRIIKPEKTAGYTAFHAFYSSTELSASSHDDSDDSYALYSSDCSDCCTDTYWYFYIPVYAQTYTTYEMLFTYERWTDYSEWSDTPVTASSTRQVETRTLYRYVNAELGDHDYKAVVTPPTATEQGYTTYTCTLCGDSYVSDYVDFNGHSYEAVVTAPTCTEQGYTTYTCTDCGDSYVSDYVDALGHDYDTVVTAPTCTEQGYTTYTCTDCGDSYVDDYVDALGHDWKNATCTEPKTCGTCGGTEGEELGHSYEAVVTPPTASEQGYTTYTCTVCGDNYVSDYVDALGHSYEAVVTAPTCTEQGYTTYTCTDCGDIYVDDYVDALGHDWKDATCTEPKTCGTCGETEGEALGHGYVATVTAPTCTEQGYTTYTCTVCGDSYVGDYVDALGHDWKDATCTEPKICGTCGETEGEALGHGYGATVTAPTCTEQGYTTYTCAACGDSYVSDYVDALGHDYDGVVTDPTCIEPGYTTYTCGICGDSYTVYDGEIGEWSTVKPEGVDEQYIETRQEYRYADYETVTSTSAALEGYTQLGSSWKVSNFGTVYYVPSWPAGFDTTSSIYAQYNTKLTDSETDTSKTVVESDTFAGYLYYHWCSADDEKHYSYANQSSTHNIFHAYYSTTEPSTYRVDTTDNSYMTSDASCTDGNSEWFFVTEVYAQSYTSYELQYSYGRWSAWSDWSAEVCTESDTRKVETRTVYRYFNAELGDHSWDDGVVVTEPTCTAVGSCTYTCVLCGETETREVESLGHDYDAVVTAPTCTAQGYTTYTCSTCGDSYVDDYVDATGHSFGEWTETKAPTCTEAGEETRTCACGETETREVESLGHDYAAEVTAPTCTAQGYTTYTCGTCGDSYVDDYVDATGHSYENGSCSVCGEADPDASQRFTLAGSNMVLGGVLDMNFFVNQTDISGTDYYAEITHYAQSGTKVTNVPYSEWGTYGAFYMLTLEGLEARQMADKIEVVIYSTDGTQVSETWTDSIRDYSMRTYEARNEKGKTLLVDMLNYGAAAQTFFSYNAGDLANNQLTEEQLAYATDSVSCTDQRVQGDNYVGSTLVLESRIILTLLFKDVTTDMYAVVTYTDHYGVVQEITVQGSEFSQYYSYYGVMVDELVVADGDQLVTVTVYNADGTVFGSATDSMNSYAARKLESDPIYEMVAKFTASAYAYFH